MNWFKPLKINRIINISNVIIQVIFGGKPFDPVIPIFVFTRVFCGLAVIIVGIFNFGNNFAGLSSIRRNGKKRSVPRICSFGLIAARTTRAIFENVSSEDLSGEFDDRMTAVGTEIGEVEIGGDVLRELEVFVAGGIIGWCKGVSRDEIGDISYICDCS
jgi:hypothetical protein